MRRACLIIVVMLLGVCVLCVGLGWFVGLPRFREAVGDGFEDAMSTEVARELAPRPGAAPVPGVYTITEDELRQSLEAEAEGEGVEDVLIRITPSELEFGFTSGSQELTYSGGVAVEDGQLVVTDFEANNDVMDFFFPAEELGAAIEDSINNYLAANGLVLDDVELQEGEMVLDVEAAP
jgi:hypothetical protein